MVTVTFTRLDYLSGTNEVVVTLTVTPGASTGSNSVTVNAGTSAVSYSVVAGFPASTVSNTPFEVSLRPTAGGDPSLTNDIDVTIGGDTDTYTLGIPAEVKSLYLEGYTGTNVYPGGYTAVFTDMATSNNEFTSTTPGITKRVEYTSATGQTGDFFIAYDDNPMDTGILGGGASKITQSYAVAVPAITAANLKTQIFTNNFPAYVICTSNVTKMNNLIQGNASFNEYIGHWDTSNVNQFTFMFGTVTSFNQDIGQWDVSNVGTGTSIGNSNDDFGFMFSGASSFNKDLSKWNTYQARSYRGMFGDCINFNQPLGIWGDTISRRTVYIRIQKYQAMFQQANSMSYSLACWDVSYLSGSPPSDFATGAPGLTSPNWFGLPNCIELVSTQVYNIPTSVSDTLPSLDPISFNNPVPGYNFEGDIRNYLNKDDPTNPPPVAATNPDILFKRVKSFTLPGAATPDPGFFVKLVTGTSPVGEFLTIQRNPGVTPTIPNGVYTTVVQFKGSNNYEDHTITFTVGSLGPTTSGPLAITTPEIRTTDTAPSITLTGIDLLQNVDLNGENVTSATISNIAPGGTNISLSLNAPTTNTRELVVATTIPGQAINTQATYSFDLTVTTAQGSVVQQVSFIVDNIITYNPTGVTTVALGGISSISNYVSAPIINDGGLGGAIDYAGETLASVTFDLYNSSNVLITGGKGSFNISTGAYELPTSDALPIGNGYYINNVQLTDTDSDPISITVPDPLITFDYLAGPVAPTITSGPIAIASITPTEIGTSTITFVENLFTGVNFNTMSPSDITNVTVSIVSPLGTNLNVAQSIISFPPPSFQSYLQISTGGPDIDTKDTYTVDIFIQTAYGNVTQQATFLVDNIITFNPITFVPYNITATQSFGITTQVITDGANTFVFRGESIASVAFDLYDTGNTLITGLTAGDIEINAAGQFVIPPTSTLSPGSYYIKEITITETGGRAPPEIFTPQAPNNFINLTYNPAVTTPPTLLSQISYFFNYLTVFQSIDNIPEVILPLNQTYFTTRVNLNGNSFSVLNTSVYKVKLSNGITDIADVTSVNDMILVNPPLISNSSLESITLNNLSFGSYVAITNIVYTNGLTNYLFTLYTTFKCTKGSIDLNNGLGVNLGLGYLNNITIYPSPSTSEFLLGSNLNTTLLGTRLKEMFSDTETYNGLVESLKQLVDQTLDRDAGLVNAIISSILRNVATNLTKDVGSGITINVNIP